MTLNVIFEGNDGTGKSTLIKEVIASMPPGHRVIHSEGPEKYDGEIDTRIHAYHNRHAGQGVIFDRHPAVSEMIYSEIRIGAPGPSLASINLFYNESNLFIYCRPNPSRGHPMDSHVREEGESDNHIQQVRDNYNRLLELYDDWALNYANVIYRIGDSKDRICKIVQNTLRR